jgi:hypothetical protein
VQFSEDAGPSDKSLYAARTDGWHLGSVAAPSSLDTALPVLAANAGGGDVEYDRGPFYLSAHPDTPWEVMLDAVARVSELGSVVLQPARSSPTPAEPNTEPVAQSDTEAEPELPPVPTGKVTIGAVDGEGPAPARKLRAELAKRTSKLEKCYSDALNRNPGTAGVFTATVAFATDGTVSSVKKKSSTLRDATLLGCAASAFYEVRLGAEAEPTTFAVTLRFELGVE